MQLQHKVAIITGASQRHWKSCGPPLCQGRREGCAWCSPALSFWIGLSKKFTKAGGEALALAGDVQDPEYTKRLVDLAESTFGGLDVGFNNAGTTGSMGPIIDMTPENWRDVVATKSDQRFFMRRNTNCPPCFGEALGP